MTFVEAFIPRAHVPAATAWAEELARGADDLPEGVAFATSMAGATLAAQLGSSGGWAAANWLAEPGTWPGVLELEAPDGAHRLGLVIATETSMEPRPVWAVDVPVRDFEGWEFDAVISVFVPKRRSIEVPDAGVTPIARIAGWLPRDVVATRFTRLWVESHPGHEFRREYLQGRVDDMRPLDELRPDAFATP